MVDGSNGVGRGPYLDLFEQRLLRVLPGIVANREKRPRCRISEFARTIEIDCFDGPNRSAWRSYFPDAYQFEQAKQMCRLILGENVEYV